MSVSLVPVWAAATVNVASKECPSIKPEIQSASMGPAIHVCNHFKESESTLMG